MQLVVAPAHAAPLRPVPVAGCWPAAGSRPKPEVRSLPKPQSLLCFAGAAAAALAARRLRALKRLQARSKEDLLARRAFNLGELFGQKNEVKIEVPADTAAVVKALKESSEDAFQAGIGRLDIELPPAYKIGLESEKKQSRLLEGKDLTTAEEVHRGDREIAHLFIEMLKDAVGGGLAVVFRNKALAEAAKEAWRKAEETKAARILAFPEGKKGQSAFGTEVGAPLKFIKKLKEMRIGCLLVVAPMQEQLQIVEELSNQVQEQMGILLINARIRTKGPLAAKLSDRMQDRLCKTFEPSFHVRFLDKKNTILFKQFSTRAESDPWILAQQRELLGGRPYTSEITRFEGEPTEEQIAAAYAKWEKTTKESEGILNIMDKETYWPSDAKGASDAKRT